MSADYKFIPPYRVGRKLGKVVLDSNGREVATFAREELSKEYVDYLNDFSKKSHSSRSVGGMNCVIKL